MFKLEDDDVFLFYEIDGERTDLFDGFAKT
jgi:hypothetical protein